MKNLTIIKNDWHRCQIATYYFEKNVILMASVIEDDKFYPPIWLEEALLVA